ncbi:MAG: cation:proton antiporter [Bacteroidaceae bacterium]|nr:cation:proton antiporter [Bacteroidaceae bacterium]
MGHLPALINDLALILVLAGIVTLLFKRLKQPLILGYIIVGFIAGPHIAFTPSVADESNVSTWADIGVIFLMFTLGLEFSFKKILKMGSAPFIAACTIIFCMIGLGSICGHFFGWSRINSLFLGGMLAMSSTTVIYKALTDMGYMQHRFASSVMSVLVIEDILGILLMVVLSTIAMSNSFQGIQLAGSLLQLALVLVVWFVVGVFIIPTFLSKARPLMSSETLLIVSLGLCFLMVVLAVKLHYSSAFGAFMAGSILAETIEAEDITKVVQPVKDLFGAIFFVSVGMLVDPQIIVQYWFPILVLILAILVGQAVFGTFGYLLSGQPLKVAMQCGFSMAQIGEFAFIIASLGNSLHVTAHFLYPVVVAVSVITTFLTPYMIRLAGPAYGFVEKHLPGSLKHTLNQTSGIPSVNSENAWKRLLRALFKQVIAYGFLSCAVIVLSFHSLLPLSRQLLGHWPGNIVCGLITLLAISPFLRAIVMRKNHSDDFRKLWRQRNINRFPLLFTILVRYVIASSFVFYIINYLSPYSTLIHWFVAFALVLLFMASKRIKQGSIALEHRFLRNLNSRELLAEEKGESRPKYAQRLLQRDVHLSLLTLPMNTMLAGRTLRQLDLARKDGVMVAAIFRQGTNINIPGPDQILFPGDTLQVIGDDKALGQFAKRVSAEVRSEVEPDESHEMILRSLTIDSHSPFKDKMVRESGLRERYRCMLIGFEDGEAQLGLPRAQRIIREGDTIWIVGERRLLLSLIDEQ